MISKVPSPVLSRVSLPAFGRGIIYCDEGGCRRVSGQPEGTDLDFILHPNRVERWEITCAIIGTERAGSDMVALTNECSGEGETWERRSAMAPLGGEDGYLLRPSECDDTRFEVHPC